jgi:hypothetical protein
LEIRGAPSWTGGTLIVDPTGSFVNPFNSCCGDGHFAWLTQRDLSGKIAFHLSLRDRPGNTAEIVSVAAGVTVPPPPPPSSGGSLTVALTSPKAAPSVTTGTVAVNVWCEGCAAGTNVYTLTVDGQQLTTQSCACLHVWPGWNTKTVLNGTHTLTATIRDSAGKGGSTSLTVLVNNG